jgi:hypothetical protein
MSDINKKAHQNHYLFSDHYLDEILPTLDCWKMNGEISVLFQKIKELYEKTKDVLPAYNESQIEERFIRPILRTLGHIYEPNPSLTGTIEGLKEPDYAFFSDEEKRRLALLESGKPGFFEKAVAIGEAKPWETPLDRKIKGEIDSVEARSPSWQMSKYLWLTGVRWGILTDGRFWRLYERETSKRIEVYYEVDLLQLIEKEDLKGFKYFYLFFRREAFPEFVNNVYEGSIDYAKKVGDDLKNNVYHALRILAEGFLETPDNNLSVEKLEEIHDNSLIFLYRLLFILYAEARLLLPLDNFTYKDSYSLDSLKKEIKDKRDRGEYIPPIQLVYWNHLKTLFSLINLGSERRRIPREDFYVPPYNGGLFDPRKHKFLEDYKVGDVYLAEVIDLLARSSSHNGDGKVFVDYRSLEIRHLGTIYEGILEYKLTIAEKDLIPIRKKRAEVYIPLEEAQGASKKFKESGIVRSGGLYLITDKGERKATGSYYTPDYIVKYIVENTLGPILEERHKRIEERVSKLEAKWRASRGYSRKIYEREIDKLRANIAEEILSIKVLDPAMGSGHFLVEATEYIASSILGNPCLNIPEMADEIEINYWKRQVVEKCIYGVDLNPLAVELAKLSLWLSTVAKGKPLSFLDHHLKTGNSLIGAKIKGLKVLPTVKKKKPKEEAISSAPFNESRLKQDMGLSVKEYLLIEKMPSESLEDIKNKGQILENLNKWRLDHWREIANLWTSTYFGVELSSSIYQQVCNSILTGKIGVYSSKFLDQSRPISKERCFFHWELEFPEVFFDEFGREKDNPGFDVVVGNPPYVDGRGIEVEGFQYIKEKFISGKGKVNLFNIFLEIGIKIAKSPGGRTSFIIPVPFLRNSRYWAIRGLILDKCIINCLCLTEPVPFEDSVVEGLVVVLANEILDEKRRNNQIRFLSQVTEQWERYYIPQKFYYSIENNKFLTSVKERDVRLIDKIKGNAIRLSSLCHINDGISTGFKPFPEILLGRKVGNEFITLGGNREPFSERIHKKIIDGGEFNRFTSVDWEDRYIKYDKSIEQNPRPIKGRPFNCQLRENYIFESVPKIISRQTANSLIATIDTERYYTRNSIHNTFGLKDRNLSLYFVLSLFNSKVLNYYYTKTTQEIGEILPQVHIVDVKQLPIRHISFTTPPDKRKKLFEEAKRFYETYFETNNWDSILFFVQQRFSAEPEESDVVHDLLAYLAEKMIEYNKVKNEEIKSFLEWLEREIGAEIENLSNKTAIKNYHKADIDSFLNILKKNKKKLKIDPIHREFQRRIDEEFTKSIVKLAPLKQKIEATDKLIDQVVYKLYGLTEEEIKIVEKS